MYHAFPERDTSGLANNEDILRLVIRYINSRCMCPFRTQIQAWMFFAYSELGLPGSGEAITIARNIHCRGFIRFSTNPARLDARSRFFCDNAVRVRVFCIFFPNYAPLIAMNGVLWHNSRVFWAYLARASLFARYSKTSPNAYTLCDVFYTTWLKKNSLFLLVCSELCQSDVSFFSIWEKKIYGKHRYAIIFESATDCFTAKHVK